MTLLCAVCAGTLGSGCGRTELYPRAGVGQPTVDAAPAPAADGRPDASDASDASDAPANGVPDGQPQGGITLTASNDIVYYVRLSWTTTAPPETVTGYVVRRDGADYAMVDAGARGYEDGLAEQGTVTPPPSLTATQGTRTDGVNLVWSPASTVVGASHEYQVVALDGTTRGLSSNPAAGACGAPSLNGYEMTRDNGESWTNVGLTTSFLDGDAPEGTIAATAETTARYPLGYVRLGVTAEPAIAPPTPTSYRVRAVDSFGVGPASDTATGYRGVGSDVHYQWQRSAADADGDYADLADVTGSLWFDATAPLDQGRYYRAMMSAAGASGATAGQRAEALSLTSVSAGHGPIGHSCAVRSDGTVICWGMIADGEALPAPPLDSFKSVSVGGAHACGVRSDDKLVCWGDDTLGQAPPGPSADSYKSVSAGRSFTCAVRADDKVVCWGDNGSGQAPPDPSADAYQSVSAGYSHACGVRADDRIVCWGSNDWGQGPPDPSADAYKSVSAGDSFTCAIRADDKLVCWGDNRNGQAPPGPSDDSYASVSASTGFMDTAGYGHACAVRSDGKLACWGGNNFGQTPAGPSIDSYASVSAGPDFTCATRVDGEVVCWGSNRWGQAPPAPTTEQFSSVSASESFVCGLRLADSTVACWGTPDAYGFLTPGPPTEPLTEITTGFDQACGIQAETNRIVCWGYDYYGGAPPGPSADTFQSLVPGDLGTCGVRTDGTIACWGDSAPALDSSFSSFKSVSFSTDYDCLVRPDDKVFCQALDGSTSFGPSVDSFKSVSSGDMFACGIRADDRLLCWGDNSSGQAPPGPSADTYKLVSATVGYACAIRSDDRLVCWGDNTDGQAPPGPSLDAFASVTTRASGDPAEFASTCAVRLSDGKVLCWGLYGL